MGWGIWKGEIMSLIIEKESPGNNGRKFWIPTVQSMPQVLVDSQSQGLGGEQQLRGQSAVGPWQAESG